MLLLNPINHYGSEDIVYVDNILSDDDIRFLSYHPSFTEAYAAMIGQRNDVNLEHRRTNIGWVDFSETNLPIWHKIAKAVSEINSQFYRINLTGFYEPMQLSEYSASFKGHYDWHTDGSKKDDKGVPRKLSMVMMLSEPDEFEGGELQVKASDVDETLEMKKGRAWFFPSYILHRVTPVTKGLRKTAVMWVGGEPWR